MNIVNKSRLRFREMGFAVGVLEIGNLNSITDVPGVSVGHSTIIQGEGILVPGIGPIRTGVTIVKPHNGNVFREKVRASSFVLNGFGKTVGLIQIQELGYIESYIGLTNTLNVPLVADALIDYHLNENPDIGITTSSIGVVVGECNDSYLNDIQGRHVKKEHIYEAIKNASEKVEEGCVGAGTGMVTYGYKGGIGTSSRIIPCEKINYVVGTLVLSNFGHKKDLMILGRKIPEKFPLVERKEDGSIMIIIATNAPLNSRQLNRLAKRASLGLARTGSYSSEGSGDIVIIFTTANKINHDERKNILDMTILNERSPIFNDLLQAVVETTEEAIFNSLCKAIDTTGRDSHLVKAISLEEIRGILNI